MEKQETPELMDIFRTIVERLKTIEERLGQLEEKDKNLENRVEAFFKVARYIGADKAKKCTYQEDGFCGKHPISDPSKRIKGRDYLKKEKNFYPAVDELFCYVCTDYQPKIINE